MFSGEFGRSGYEQETALSEIERHETLAELARDRQMIMDGLAAGEVGKHPGLMAILSKLIEGGPELSSDHRGHLRRMAAIYYDTYSDYARASQNAEMDADLHEMAATSIQAELVELEVGEGWPDMWDVAYEDLLKLESGDQGA
jgi:hypothetical protein